MRREKSGGYHNLAEDTCAVFAIYALFEGYYAMVQYGRTYGRKERILAFRDISVRCEKLSDSTSSELRYELDMSYRKTIVNSGTNAISLDGTWNM